jgi:hypothetical protein
MPFTFAHPAAVLPLRRYCPTFLNFPALVVGSMTPDAGYYLHNWQWAMWGHTFAGSLTFDVPAGLAFLAVFYLFLRPVSALLPAPHRQTLVSWIPARRLPSLTQVLVAAYSVMLGSWTHIVWDGFTHANGWCVRNVAALTPTVFSIGSYQVTVWQLLQLASTVFGFIVLWQAYSEQVRKQSGAIPSSERTDMVATVAVLVVPAVVACGLSASAFRSGINMFNLASFAYSAAVRYVDLLFPALLVVGLLVSCARLLMRLRPSVAPLKSDAVVTGQTEPVLATADLSSKAAVDHSGAPDHAGVEDRNMIVSTERPVVSPVSPPVSPPVS